MGGKAFQVEGPVTSERLSELDIEPEIKNFRPAHVQKKALTQIASGDVDKVFIAVSQGKIIGYVAFHRPHEMTRWSRLPFVIELGAIEISPNWRYCGVAKALMHAAAAHGFMENHVVTSLEYAWHWDLKGTGLDMWSYQNVLFRLFSLVGFEVFSTDDPDIVEHPANIFMTRIGKNVSEKEKEQFMDLLFTGEKWI